MQTLKQNLTEILRTNAKQLQFLLIFVAILLFSNLNNVFSQALNTQLNDVVMPSPTATSLGKFGDIPVNYSTGIPNLGIPLFAINEGPLTLPISLSYNASGIKVGENAGWVGINWSLNTGGIITRTVLGT